MLSIDLTCSDTLGAVLEVCRPNIPVRDASVESKQLYKAYRVPVHSFRTNLLGGPHDFSYFGAVASCVHSTSDQRVVPMSLLDGCGALHYI